MIHISRISMTNFKSFRRVSIPIKKGFTAIVGPNGSGKSNIVDGICFVLGRSSAKSLRAERFSDLIFNGGKKGKPANMAEVSLYLDNSGGEIPIPSSEIKISRTLDTSGNSVYRINGKRKSRAEILDVLSASKIQPDGHNIVLQGDITQLIEMNPVERRGVIDEIAGIAEYDEKKRKAIRELEKVSDNISTVDAVLSEVRAQMKRLEKEREDALRHEFLKSEIRRSRGIVLYSNQLEITEKLEEIEKNIRGADEKNEKINKFLDILALKLEVKKKQLEKLGRAISLKEETEKFEVFRELEKLRNELDNWRGKLEDARENAEELEKRYAECKREIVETHNSIRKHDIENEVLENEKKSINKKISEIKARIEKEYGKISEDKVSLEKKERLSKYRGEFEKWRGKLLEVERDNALMIEKKWGRERVHAEVSEELNKRKAKLDDLIGIQNESAARKKRMDDETAEKLSRRGSIIDEEVEIRKKITKVTTLLQLKNEELAKLNAEYKAYEDISKNRAAFDRAVGAVLEMRRGTRGIYGTISELGDVVPRFSRALEIAAGVGMHFIVVDTDKTAEKCIAHLKENKIGRATFLPLNRLKVTAPTRSAAKIARESYGFAINLVKFEAKFKKAFAHVFRNTVVVKDIEFARRAGIGNARMVTLDGDLIETSGKMSGGFYRLSKFGFEEAGISRRKLESLREEIEKLSREREELLKKDEEIKQELSDINSLEIRYVKEREVLSGKMNSCRESIDEIRALVAEKEVLLSDISSEIKELSEKIALNEAEIKKLSEKVSALAEEKDSIEAELQGTDVERLLKGVRELESQIFECEKEKEKKNSQIGLNNSKVEEILRPRFTELSKELVELFKSRKAVRVELSKKEGKKAEIEKRLSELEKRESSVVEEIENQKKMREFFVRGIDRISKKRESLREELASMGRSMESARIERARLETKLEEVNRAFEKYSDIELKLPEKVDINELESEIVKMEHEMASLEPINMRAIEDYDVIKKKFDNFDTRVSKLLEEKEAIIRLMDEIEQRKKAVFMEVFENIAMNFRRIFSQLSGGGTADLLLDEENPLEGGLQIQAKPAGSNPQYIELMSGGEKTLTALTFIFSIQRYQPAPFYILDEIDMFLDRENVKKVSELLKESARDAQFIVVSLRDDLMIAADQLFGAANEDGISRIIGVELEEVAG